MFAAPDVEDVMACARCDFIARTSHCHPNPCPQLLCCQQEVDEKRAKTKNTIGATPLQPALFLPLRALYRSPIRTLKEPPFSGDGGKYQHNYTLMVTRIPIYPYTLYF